MNKTTTITLLTALALGGSFGCSFMKRGPDKYRDDTRALLETHSDQLKACYDSVLAGDKAAAGTVTVAFIVSQETGVIRDAKLDAGASTAPQGVQDCVVNSLEGLTLEPGDADEGQATFTYEFEIAPQKTAPAPPAAPAAAPTPAAGS